MKILNTIAGIVGSKFFGRPFYARYHITHRCNQRCRMCRLHKLADESKELTLPKVQELSKRLYALGARHLVLTGGEPFLRKDIVEVVKTFSEQGFSLRIQSNGGSHLSRELLSECAKAGLRDLSISIDTLNRSLQDDICQSKNVVDNALRSLRMARELLPKGISQANVVASRYNFQELPQLLRFFHSLGVYTYITPVMIDQDQDKLDGNEKGDYLFRSSDADFSKNYSPAQIDRTIGELLKLRKENMGLTNSSRYLRDYRKYLPSGVCSWKCEAGSLSLDIFPDGSLSICKENPPMGSIFDDEFLRYYLSKEGREAAHEQAFQCSGCFYGEYREPQYAVRDLSVFWEWATSWLKTFHRGMRLGERPQAVQAVQTVKGEESRQNCDSHQRCRKDLRRMS